MSFLPGHASQTANAFPAVKNLPSWGFGDPSVAGSLSVTCMNAYKTDYRKTAKGGAQVAPHLFALSVELTALEW
jgi:hypothetical protein